MKATILVPVIGYFIIFNESVARYLHLVWEVDTHVAPPTNLLLVYFGLVFLSAGSIVYALFCDRRVDQYGSEEAYIGGDGPNISALSYAALEKEVLEAGYDFDAPMEDGLSPIGPFDKRKESLSYVYDKWNRDFPLARGATTICYVIGFAILAIPSVSVLWKVLWIMIERMF